MTKIRVAIVDDDALIRQTLGMLLDLEPDLTVVAQGDNCAAALTILAEDRPDVLLLDMRMEPLDGISAVEQMSATDRRKVLVLSTFDEDRYVIPAINFGVAGYILKNARPEEIIRAIRQTAAGQNVLGPEAMGVIRQNLRGTQEPGDIFSELSARELEVVKAVAKGLSNKEIADQLFLSEGTVKNHISNILAKTGLVHRTRLAIAWLRGE